MTGASAGGKGGPAGGKVTAAGAEPVRRGTGAGLRAGGLETGAGALLQRWMNPRYPAWPQSGPSGMAAAGRSCPCPQGHQTSEAEAKTKQL